MRAAGEHQALEIGRARYVVGFLTHRTAGGVATRPAAPRRLPMSLPIKRRKQPHAFPNFPSNHESAHAQGIVRGERTRARLSLNFEAYGQTVCGRVCGTRHGPRCRPRVAASAQHGGRTWADPGVQYPSSGEGPVAASALAQHDLPHRPAADALDAAEQFCLPCPAAASRRGACAPPPPVSRYCGGLEE